MDTESFDGKTQNEEPKKSLRNKRAFEIFILYLLLGITWILISDSVVHLLSANREQELFIQGFKGIAYVAISGLLVFWLARRTFGKYEKEALQHQLDQLKNTLEVTLNNLGEVVFTVGPGHRRITSCNEAVRKVFGFAPEELIGKTTEILHESKESFIHFGEIGEKKLTRDGAFKTHHRMKRKDGQIIETANTIINLDTQGGWEKGVISIVEDITEQIETRRELQDREQHYRLLTENQLDLVWALDLDMNFTYTNKASENLLGYTQQEMKGMNLSKILPQREFKKVQSVAEENLLKENAENGAVFTTEHICKDGSIVPVEVHGKILYNEKGQPTGYQGTTRDITERLSLEAKLRQSQKLESIGTLASGIAHEINNPVHGIKGYASLIKENAKNDEETKEFIGEILAQTDQIHTIVDNLLGLARNEEQGASMLNVPVEEIMESTLSLTRTVMRQDSIQLEINISKNMPPLYCHKQQIQQVFLNLLTNARDSLNEKYTKRDQDKTIRINASLCFKNKKRMIRITIEDHGKGINPEVRERMFEPFFTTKPEGQGTGLGMWIIYGILKDHDGEIRVESEEGRFARFCIDLPTINGTQKESGQDDEKKAITG